MLEKCLYEKKYKYIRSLCYFKFKDKYTLNKFYEYCESQNTEGIYYCVINEKIFAKNYLNYNYDSTLKVFQLFVEIFNIDLYYRSPPYGQNRIYREGPTILMRVCSNSGSEPE